MVTTIAPTLTSGARRCFVGSLAVGEKQTVSFGEFGTTAVPRTLGLTHSGDHLVAKVVDAQVTAR